MLEGLFYKCKSKCFSTGPCNAKGLKERPNLPLNHETDLSSG